MVAEGSVVVVRCPRCGSMDAGSVDFVLVELDRMRCGDCGYEAVCDEYEIKDDWNQRVDALTRRRGHVLPDVRFRALMRQLGAASQYGETYEMLRVAYDEPQRAYHTARHVTACLRLLDDPAVRALAASPSEVEAALWFHDAVYDPHANDNEEKSAKLAEALLEKAGVSDDVIGRVADHVRVTKDHSARSTDGQLVVDIDLSILGEGEEVFTRFEGEIRREYAWVDDQAYARGRSAVLLRFDEREHIFRTPLLRDRYEANARRNIAAALRRWST